MMKNPLRVLIITCWILLIVCMLIKVSGFNIFEPDTDNTKFIEFCEYIDSVFVLKVIIASIFSLFLNTLTILAILGQKFYTKCQIFIFVPLIISTSIISWYSNIVYIILNILYFLLPIIWLKKRWYRVIIGFGLILTFQFISIITRNLHQNILNNETTLVSIIMQVDSIIMIILYYLYSNYLELKRKEHK